MLELIKNNIIYFLLAVIGVTAFFAHETIAPEDWRVTKEGVEWEKSKNEALVALDNFKEAYKDTKEYKIYKQKADLRDAELLNLNKVIDKSKFLGFRDFQQFMGEFGWALGLFLYALFNIIITFIRKPKPFIGDVLYHTAHITVAVFYLRWCFNRKDFLILEYFTYNILTSILVIISIYLLVRYKQKFYIKLQKALKALDAISRFAFITVKKYIHPEEMDEYNKESIETLKKGMK